MADSKLAVAEAQKSFATDKEGLLEGNDEVIAVSTASLYQPFRRNQYWMGRGVYERQYESLLVGYEDPRLEKYFNKAAGSDNKYY